MKNIERHLKPCTSKKTMNANSITLYLFEAHEPNDREMFSFKLDYVREKEDLEVFHLESEKLRVLDDNIKINSSFTTHNMAYSFILYLNDCHTLTVMGNKKSWESSDPCILFVTPGGIAMQVSIVDGEEE